MFPNLHIRLMLYANPFEVKGDTPPARFSQIAGIIVNGLPQRAVNRNEFEA